MFNGWSGYAKPIALLRGSQSQTIKKYHSHPLHGKGRFKSEDYWHALADQLERLSFFEKKSMRNVQQNTFGHTIKVTWVCDKWLNANEMLKLKPTDQMYKFLPKKRTAPLYDVSSTASHGLPGMLDAVVDTKTNADKQLKDSLAMMRTALAAQFGTMPYLIASNLALDQIAAVQPLSLDEIRAAKIDGMSEAKIVKFGQKFVTCILKWKRFLGADAIDANPQSLEAVLQLNPYPGVKVTACHERVKHLLDGKKSIDQIAAALSLKESTVISYVATLIKAGHPITKKDIRQYSMLDESTVKHIESHLPAGAAARVAIRIGAVKEQCRPDITYTQLSLVVAYHQVRAHLDALNVPYCDPDKVETKMEIEPASPAEPETAAKPKTLAKLETPADDKKSEPDEIIGWDDDDSCFGQIEGVQLEPVVEELSPARVLEPASTEPSLRELAQQSILLPKLDPSKSDSSSAAPSPKIVSLKQLFLPVSKRSATIDSMFDKDGDDVLGNLNFVEVKKEEAHPLAPEEPMETTATEEKKVAQATATTSSIADRRRKHLPNSKPNKRIMYDDSASSGDEDGTKDMKSSLKRPPALPQWIQESVQRAKSKPNARLRTLF